MHLHKEKLNKKYLNRDIDLTCTTFDEKFVSLQRRVQHPHRQTRAHVLMRSLSYNALDI